MLGVLFYPHILIFGSSPFLKRESLIKKESALWASPSYVGLETMYLQKKRDLRETSPADIGFKSHPPHLYK